MLANITYELHSIQFVYYCLLLFIIVYGVYTKIMIISCIFSLIQKNVIKFTKVFWKNEKWTF